MIIKIPNSALYSEGENILSPDETLIYAFLFQYHNLDDKIIFNINMLSEVFKFQKGNDRKNRPYIKQILLSLQNKKYITTNLSINSDYYTVITGSILNIESGYSGVDDNVLNAILDENETYEAKIKFYLYSYINRYTHQEGTKIDYKKLSSVCRYFDGVRKSYSVTKIQQMVNEMDGKYIFRFSGERLEGSPEQETNIYFTQIDEDKMKQYRNHVDSKIKNKSVKRKDGDILPHNPWVYAPTVGELREALLSCNWHKRKLDGTYEELVYHDYCVYRFAKDQNVAISKVRRCEATISALKDNENCLYDFDKWENEYQKDKQYIEYNLEDQ